MIRRAKWFDSFDSTRIHTSVSPSVFWCAARGTQINKSTESVSNGPVLLVVAHLHYLLYLIMPETPGKRGRDDEEENTGFFSRIFSTAKKSKRARVETSTEATAATMPRLNLSSPSAMMMNGRSPPVAATSSVPIQQQRATVTFAEETVIAPPAAAAAARIARQQTPAAPRVPPAAAARAPPPPSPWQERPIQFQMGTFSAPSSLGRRRRPYRPNSRTLVPSRRRRTTTPDTYNAELVQRLLQPMRNVLQPDPAYLAATITTAPGRRQFGTNQTGSRLHAASAAPIRKKVSFDNSAAATPRSNGAQQRTATPYTRAPMQQDYDEEEEVSFGDNEAPLPTDFAALPRLDAEDVSNGAPISFENADTFVDTAPRRGTLVAERLPPSFFVTTVAVPPPTRGYAPDAASEEEEEDSKPAAVETVTSPQNEEEEDTSPDQQPQTKRSRPDTWGDTFKDHNKGWKCEVCMSRNPEIEQVQCRSCETPRPGREDDATEGGEASAPPVAASGSIGAGGFSFGASTTTTASSGGGFSFGTGPPSEATPRPFSFGNNNASSAEGASGVSSAVHTGFSFGAAKSDDTTSPAEQSSKKLRFSLGSSDGGDGGDDKKKEQDESKPAAATASGFSFGSAAKPAAQEESKEEESKPVATPGFSFGVAAKPAQEEKKDETAEKDTKTATPGFSFGSATKPADDDDKEEESKPAATTPGFSFGAAAASGSTGGFSLGSSAAAKPSDSKDDTATESEKKDAAEPAKETTDAKTTPGAGFAFGTKPAPKTEPKPATGGFSFGGTSTAESGDSTAPATEGKASKSTFSFGGTKPSESSQGSDTPATDSNAMGPPPSRPFTFGGSTTPAPAPVPTDSGPSLFSFGGTSAAPAASTTQAATTTTGANETTTTSSSLFGNLTPAPTQNADGDSKKKRRAEDDRPSASGDAASTSSFTFGTAPAPSTTAPASIGSTFGTSTTPAATTPGTDQPFAFGQAATADASTPAQPFTFGQTPANTPAAPPTNPPSFGGQTAPSSGFGQQQNGGSSNPFGGSTATTPAPAAMSFGSATPAAQAPAPSVSFNFGTSNPTLGATPSFGTPAPPPSGTSTQPGFSGGFGSAQPSAPFGGAPSASSGFTPGSFGTAPAPATIPGGGFGGGFGSQAAPAPAVNGFGGAGFGGATSTTPNVPTGGGATGGFSMGTASGGGGFSMGTSGGGGSSRGSARGRRRIVRAKRPGSGR